MEHDIVVVGGGVIGLSCAWKLAQKGIKVLLLERGELGREASWTAGGMIAPGCEMIHSTAAPDDAMSRFCFHSRDLYCDFAAELEEISGIDIELSLKGAKSIDDDWRTPGILLMGEAGKPLAWTSPSEDFDLSTLPFLAPDAHDLPALWLPDEGQVDSRKLVRALIHAAYRSGVEIWEDAPVHRIHHKNGKLVSLETAAGVLRPSKVLLCAGAWSGQIEGFPSGAPPVHPVAGQMLSLRPNAKIDRVIYAKPDIYLIPRRDGRLVLGSSVEEIGFEKHTTRQHAERKWRDAVNLVPALKDSEIVEHWCGFRPAAPDGLPLMGASAIENCYIATGHFRNGILMAPATAELMTDFLLNDREIDPAFAPTRFR